jgi:hypothetical protein
MIFSLTVIITISITWTAVGTTANELKIGQEKKRDLLIKNIFKENECTCEAEDGRRALLTTNGNTDSPILNKQLVSSHLKSGHRPFRALDANPYLSEGIPCPEIKSVFGDTCKHTNTCTMVFRRTKRVTVTGCVSECRGGTFGAGIEVTPKSVGGSANVQTSWEGTTTQTVTGQYDEIQIKGKCKWRDNWGPDNDCYCNLSQENWDKGNDWVSEELPPNSCKPAECNGCDCKK